MKKEIKIAFTNPWNYQTNAESLRIKSRLTRESDGTWENLVGIDDPYEADWIIGWETLDPNIDFSKIDMSKVILTGREPPWMLAMGDGYKYDNWDSFPDVKYKFKHALGNSHLLSSWTSSLSYREMKDVDWTPRRKKICVVMSSKRFCHGHAARLDFVKRFCYKYPGILDIYGNGMLAWCQQNGLKSHYRGCSPFGKDCSKHSWISKYEYSLSFENGILNGYFSEKFNDVMMAFTKPIFWGAKDIGKYFPKDSYEYLDILKPDATDVLYHLIQKPIFKKDIEAMSTARDLILDVWNEWPSIKRIIETGKVHPEWWGK